jgi:hypothetical protein
MIATVQQATAADAVELFIGAIVVLIFGTLAIAGAVTIVVEARDWRARRRPRRIRVTDDWGTVGHA